MKRFRSLTIALFAALAFTGCSSRGDNLSNNARGALDGYGSGYNTNYSDGMYGNSNNNGYGTDGYGYPGYGYGGNDTTNGSATGVIYDGADGYSGSNGSGAYGSGTTGYGTVYNGVNGMPYTSTTANQ